ncbi:MAG: 3,4-dihydroxy-2-butanone-4-phosphate synthase [Veillonella sp.]|nr:3,4-dihydroxy-2-butanone-4-phosphate synthase [Veillonella sp.]
MSEQLHSINEVLQDLKTGKPVIIVDDESRENEGDPLLQSLRRKKTLTSWLNTLAVSYVRLCAAKR